MNVNFTRIRFKSNNIFLPPSVCHTLFLSRDNARKGEEGNRRCQRLCGWVAGSGWRELMESVRVSHRRGILLMQKSRKQDDFILLHICLSLKHTKCIQGRRRGGSQDNSSRGTGICALCKVCTIYMQAVTLAPIMFSSSVLGRSKEPRVLEAGRNLWTDCNSQGSEWTSCMVQASFLGEGAVLYLGTRAHMCRNQMWPPSVFLNCPAPDLFRQGLLMNVELDDLAKLPG